MKNITTCMFIIGIFISSMTLSRSAKAENLDIDLSQLSAQPYSCTLAHNGLFFLTLLTVQISCNTQMEDSKRTKGLYFLSPHLFQNNWKLSSKRENRPFKKQLSSNKFPKHQKRPKQGKFRRSHR